ncbi:nuclease-related domain-containing DEAD/DEAH box helicase [Demequina iriomotensis]|uniref:nuclease-related domain-containing DEAD/DEAH box helicase n=1 Tax=Demequina iriomotensis TaxID=1536641 RepID=UPI0009E48DFF|nr:NERD domain-containing protein/DEAD/DEAH box helicase [Demequina iriomotensis]
MARLIPPLFPEDAAPGEKAVYRALAKDRTTDDWIVLHSLNIAEHVRNPEGEADFVVIAPNLGVLVIEVKSHEHFSFDHGVWKLGNQAPTARGPFKQASEAMYSIREDLLKKKVDLRSIPTLSAAWFTATRARTMLKPTNEWSEWQVLDSEDLKKDPIGAIRRAFAGGVANLDATFRGFSDRGVGPDLSMAARLASLLRPNFEFGVVAGDIRSAREHQLVHFVEEQFLALDAMSDNKSVLFTGPAGSGKTLLAMEAARRELALKRTGSLVCFNKLLARRLMVDMGDPHLSVGTFHSQLLALTGIKAPSTAGDRFWTRELPDRAVEALLERGEPPADFLIIDEIQDLLTDAYLDVFDFMVKGGLSGGRVLMFGDFERQAIYDDGRGRALLEARMPHLPSHRLTMNCRNLPRIGTSVNFFSGLTPGYRKFRRDDDGTNPVFLKYARGADQSALLRKAIEGLREEKFDLSEIVVLSPLGSGSTAATTTDPWLRNVLVQADDGTAKRGKIRFSSIQAFKGLEAPAIVVTDLDRRNVPNFESVLYVGLTRATDRLYGVIEETTGLAGMAGNP